MSLVAPKANLSVKCNVSKSLVLLTFFKEIAFLSNSYFEQNRRTNRFISIQIDLTLIHFDTISPFFLPAFSRKSAYLFS